LAFRRMEAKVDSRFCGNDGVKAGPMTSHGMRHPFNRRSEAP